MRVEGTRQTEELSRSGYLGKELCYNMNLDRDFTGLKVLKRARTGKEGRRFLKDPPMTMLQGMPMLQGMLTVQSMLMLQEIPNKGLEQSLP